MMQQKSEVQPAPEVSTRKRMVRVGLTLVGFSTVYFTRAYLFASEKYFWYDELLTVYKCRLPSWHAMWEALRQGFDFNPPLFYFIMRINQMLLGEGLIVTRIPQMLGFWVFCVCLFRLVSRRTGLLAGYIAMVLPLFTGAFYYAFEARPYGMVLGFCGLALVGWQMACVERGRHRHFWLFGFGSSLLAACLIHCYAIALFVPFALVELFRFACSGRLDWKFWLALVFPAVVAGLSYIPLFLEYQKLCKGTNFAVAFLPHWNALPRFYLFLFTPCIVLVFASLSLMTVRLTQLGARNPAGGGTDRFAAPEILVAVCFLALPIFCILLARLTHDPFINRYSLAATAGFSILIAMGAGMGKKPNWASITLAVLLTYLAGEQFGDSLTRRHRRHIETLVEPSSGFSMNVSLGGPLDQYSILVSRLHSSLPVVVSYPLDFLYLVNYAPDFAPRLYYINQSESDFFVRTFRNLQPWFPVKYNQPIAFDEFVHRFPEFILYGKDWDFSDMAKHGCKIRSWENDAGRFLVQVDMETPLAAAR